MSKTVMQGYQMFNQIKVGDTVVDHAGNEIQKKYCALNNAIMYQPTDNDVVVFSTKDAIVDSTEIASRSFTAKEVSALKDFFNSL